MLKGQQVIISCTEQEVLDYFGNISGYYCFFRDITAAREYEEMILKFANTDGLTELYNRRYFFNHINDHCDGAMTILFMDMDNFKKVNDTFGHNKGDEVLVSTAKAIDEVFSDCLTARLGGDEFAVLADEDIPKAELSRRSEELIKKLEKEYAPLNLGVSISIGMAHSEGHIEDIDAFIHESDQMMYSVKQEKKARG